jgi:hypothetical protein
LDEGAGPGEEVADAADSLWLGADTTTCLLEWELTRGRKRGLAVFDVFDTLCKTDTGFRQVRMNGDAVCRYAAQLSVADQRAVVDGIAKNRSASHWAAVLQEPGTTWFRLAIELAGRHRPSLFSALSKRQCRP